MSSCSCNSGFLNSADRYRVAEYPGVAFYFHGYVKEWWPYQHAYLDEDGDEQFEATIEGEWIEQIHGPYVLMVMVGDDKVHTIERNGVSTIDDNEYCSTCGQIGCHALSIQS